MRHFELLQEKIGQMEARHATRERELQQLLSQAQAVSQPHLTMEMDRLKRLLDLKNRETERFRSELDSILEVLKELQRQGVILPVRGVGSDVLR